jgi:hypothetical protein
MDHADAKLSWGQLVLWGSLLTALMVLIFFRLLSWRQN